MRAKGWGSLIWRAQVRIMVRAAVAEGMVFGVVVCKVEGL